MVGTALLKLAPMYSAIVFFFLSRCDMQSATVKGSAKQSSWQLPSSAGLFHCGAVSTKQWRWHAPGFRFCV